MDWAAALFWLILLVVCILMEASTVSIVSLWFAAGALVSMILSLLHVELWIQVVVFFAVSGVLLGLLRPVIKKHFNPRLTKTNVDCIVGSRGIVSEDIDNLRSAGRIKLGALDWSARSTNQEVICAGTQVQVDRVEGAKVFVSKVEQEV